jgi:iron complex transport system substrate-binding protein
MAACPAKPLWGFVRPSNAILTLLCALVCGCTQALPVGEAHDRPRRIVSLDYCADQFVLGLADRGDIVALSPDAGKSFSYLRKEAVGLPQVRASAEEVLALKPDLIVRSYGGGPNAATFFARAGVKVHQIGWGEDFDAVRKNVSEAATALGQMERGRALNAQFDLRLKELIPSPPLSTLYLTAGGVSTGSGTMVDRMMRQAGLVNFQKQPGWHPISVEDLARAQPDIVAFARFGDQTDDQDQWSLTRHPVVTRMLGDRPVASFDGATTTCAGWFVVDAIEAMAAQGHAAQKVSP